MFHYVSLWRIISATAYPLAKPFNGEGAMGVKSVGKMLPGGQALDAIIGGHPNYGDGGVVREVRL